MDVVGLGAACLPMDVVALGVACLPMDETKAWKVKKWHRACWQQTKQTKPPLSLANHEVTEPSSPEP